MTYETGVKRLSDFAQVKGGKRVPKGTILSQTPTPHPYIKVRDMQAEKYLERKSAEEYLEEEAWEKLAPYATQAGDIVVSIVGTVGLICVVGKTMDGASLTENCARIVDVQGMNPDFLYYWLASSHGQNAIRLSAVGAVQAKLSLKNLLNLPIPYIPREKQDEMAAVLTALDNKIAVNLKMNDCLAAMAQATFKTWLLDFEPFGGKQPTSWREGSLLDIADYLNGVGMQRFPPEEGAESLPVLKIRELRQGFCDGESDNCAATIRSDYIVRDGDVIFSWSGSLLLDFWCGGACGLNQHLFKVTSAQYDRWFAYLWTQHHMEEFAGIAADKATTMGHIKRENLYAAKVLIPDDENYRTMGILIGPLYEKIVQNRLENRRLTLLRDTLLPRFMDEVAAIAGMKSITKGCGRS